jgi:hypothetical protein
VCHQVVELRFDSCDDATKDRLTNVLQEQKSNAGIAEKVKIWHLFKGMTPMESSQDLHEEIGDNTTSNIAAKPPIAKNTSTQKARKPILMIICGILLFEVWAWFAMSSMDYHEGAPFWGLKTAGWFILGSPFLVGIGFVGTLLFVFIGRKLHPFLGWVCLLLLGSILIAITFNEVLPENRLSSRLRVDLPPGTTIYRLRQGDSFNDGISIYGIFSGSKELMDEIAGENDLTLKEMSLEDFVQYFDDKTLPSHGDAYVNERMTCYFDDQLGKIFFAWHTPPTDR